MIKELLRLHKRTYIWVGAIMLIAGLVIISFAVLQNRKPLSPALAAAQATGRLIETTKKMQTSFGPAPTNPGKVTRQYLKYMDRLQADCLDLKAAFKDAKQQVASPDLIILLNNSDSLCKDLSALAQGSTNTYTATLPLLSSPTKVKRYQTAPFIKHRIQSNNEKDVAKALKQLEDNKNTDGYPSAVVDLLKNLQATIQGSKDLAYLPSLQTFQLQVLAERQQYWTGYGEVSGLVRTLQNQLRSYCQSPQLSKDEPGVCSQVKDL